MRRKPVLLEVFACALGAFMISTLLTGAIRKLALAHGMMDVPNQRSSHATPTPRGGGVAIVVATSIAAVVLAILGVLEPSTLLPLLVGGAAVAVIGFLDDRIGLSPRVRFSVHLGAAAAAMYWLGGLPPMQVGDDLVSFGWAGYLLGILGIGWSLNLFNFMDGIDGIAASEAIFMTAGGAAIAVVIGMDGSVAAFASVLAMACLGFLAWNWPPAKIFMGDAGSGYLGYVLAVLALLAGRESVAGLLVWLILGGVFFVDATLTLARRLARGERVHQAHRTHAYQWLARRWRSHRRVTVLVCMINLLWLFPLACLAALRPGYAAWIALLALVPIAIAASISGAGQPERASGDVVRDR
jgi:Fuc2NAc and GlcNAc transferase